MVFSSDRVGGGPGAQAHTDAPVQVSPDSFEELYQEHFEYVWRRLLRLGVPESDLMDATQNVFMVVHCRLGEFEGRASITTWLFEICRRVASNIRRRPARSREVMIDATELTMKADAAPTAVFQVEQRQQVKQALQLMDKLPDDQRVVFMMFELEELSCAQIGELLNIPEGTARSKLRRARTFFSRQAERIALSRRKRQEDV